MKKFTKLVLILLACTAPLRAYAYDEIKWLNVGTTTVLNGIALNGSAASRTFTYINGTNKGMGLLSVQIAYTFGAATAVNLVCKGSIDASATLGSFMFCTDAAGVCTANPRSFTTPTNNVNGVYLFVIDVRGADELSCVISGTGANGSDLVTVKTKLTAFSG